MLTNNTVYQMTTGILTASGGAGHINAAKNEATKHPHTSITVNVIEEGWLNFQWLDRYTLFKTVKYIPYLKNYLTRNYGKENVEKWNKAQKEGNLDILNRYINSQGLADKCFGKNFYDKTLALLIQYPTITSIVTTQPMGYAHIHKAIARFNRLKSPHLPQTEFKIILTDLLTPYAPHFLNSIKSIEEKYLFDCPINIVVPYPAVDAEQPTIEDYHYALAKLCPELYIKNTISTKPRVKIEFTMGPIDAAFLNINELIKAKTAEVVKRELKQQPLPVQYTTDACAKLEALPHLKNLFSSLNTQSSISLSQHSQVKTLMLGSQASVHGTLAVIDFEFQIDDKFLNTDTPTYLFVFCGNDTSPHSLFSQVCELSKKCFKKNPNFYVIPLTVQENKAMIAQLYTIADLIITRPGGMSVMEIKAVATGYVIIFAEVSDRYTEEQLEREPSMTLIIWEKGNSYDLIKKLGEARVSILNVYNYMTQRLKQLVIHYNANPIPKFLSHFNRHNSFNTSTQIKVTALTPRPKA